MNAQLQTNDVYRLPWTLNDNVLGWLEPTKACNLYCEGCYSANLSQSHKTLDNVRKDMDVFIAKRTMDSISVAGGDPLTHPNIVDIVRIIRDEYDLKPVLNTNGLALTPELLSDLADAGVHGFTFHIDSSQTRPYWKDKTELELNELRLKMAQMVDAQGGLSCSFNMTVFPHTLKYVPQIMDWATEHIDIVHAVVFILFRTSRPEDYDYLAQGEQVDVEDLAYYTQEALTTPLQAHDVIARIRDEHDPDFAPSAYLGGTKDPKSFKWLLAGRIGHPGHVHGYVGKRYMELIQTTHHLFTGKYLGYAAPELLSAGRSMMAAFSPVDQGIRKTARSFLSHARRAPWRLSNKQHFQSILIIQPIDMMPDGEMNMCDGCPDMTVHEGELVWSCRLDELKAHGCFLSAVPKCGGGRQETADT